jgi:hypothetical protein
MMTEKKLNAIATDLNRANQRCKAQYLALHRKLPKASAEERAAIEERMVPLRAEIDLRHYLLTTIYWSMRGLKGGDVKAEQNLYMTYMKHVKFCVQANRLDEARALSRIFVLKYKGDRVFQNVHNPKRLEWVRAHLGSMPSEMTIGEADGD